MYQLKGKLYGALIMNKIYSADQTRQFKFCYFCNEYYSHSSGDCADWKYIWPSFIFTAMKSRNTKYDVLKQALPIILPLEIKRMWSSEIQEFANERNVFLFRSNDLDLFLENVTSSLGGFVQMLNNYCFPDVKCPLGCWQFMDYCQEIPLHHYLHYKFNFKLRNSNSKLFISSRKDWPSTDLFLRWKIKPALVISKKNGLSILVCKYHTHNDLSLKYFHLPKNPHYDPYQKSIPETFATCSIEPNVIRHAVSSTMNTSAAKINVLGGYYGLTTYSIAGKSSVERVFHSKDTIAHVISAV